MAGKRVDLIKVDVQGAELLVFAGGHKLLEQATFVQVEGSTIEYNEGGSCSYEVDDLLRKYGFFLYDISDMSYNAALFKTTGLGQYDIMYVKPSSPWLPSGLKEAKYCGQGRSGKSDVLRVPAMDDAFPMLSPTMGLSWPWGFVSGFICCLVLQRVLDVVRRRKQTKLVVRKF
jgi:Methyltransferase FkbM domain